MVRMLSFVLDKKAQAGIELLIFVGVFLILSITLVPYVLKNNELNIALTCARDGATYGLHVLKLGYNVSNEQSLAKYSENLKLDKVEILYIGKSEEKRKYRIKAIISGCDNLNSSEKSSLYALLRNFMKSYVSYCVSEKYSGGFSNVETEYHIFTFSAVCR